MVIEHLFYVERFMFIEYANRVYKYCKENNIEGIKFFLFKKKIKENVKFCDIPDEELVSEEELRNSTVINAYGNYFRFVNRFGKAFEYTRLHKISYGYGNEDQVIGSVTWTDPKRHANNSTVAFLGLSPYECWCYHTSKHKLPSYDIGMIKLDNSIKTDFDEEIKRIETATKYDKTKPTILFLHTYDKSDELDNRYYEGISDYAATAKFLEKYIDRYNIIHKNHYYTDRKFRKFINTWVGLCDSKFLLELADVVIADYGGSAIEALLSDKKILYINDERHSEINAVTNIDAKVHNIFTSCTASELPDMFDNFLNTPVSDEEMKTRIELRDYLFKNAGNSIKNFVDYVFGRLKPFDVEKFLNDPVTKKYGFDWKWSDFPGLEVKLEDRFKSLRKKVVKNEDW